MYVTSRQDPDYKFVFYMILVTHEAKEKSAASSLNELSLKIYGITYAVPQIVSRFVAMIQSKLDEVAVTILGTSLARNPSKKLHSSDIGLLLPLEKKATLKIGFEKYIFDVPANQIFGLLRRNLPSIFYAIRGVNREDIVKHLSKNCFVNDRCVYF